MSFSVPELSTDPRALRAVKRPLPVRVRFAVAEGMCLTLEGPVAYRAGDAILTGIAGENWPVGRAKFDERYAPIEDTSPGADGNYVKLPLVVLALRLDAPLEVSMPTGGILNGNTGDWLLQYGQSDFGIVKDEIFRSTYDVQ